MDDASAGVNLIHKRVELIVKLTASALEIYLYPAFIQTPTVLNHASYSITSISYLGLNIHFPNNHPSPHYKTSTIQEVSGQSDEPPHRICFKTETPCTAAESATATAVSLIPFLVYQAELDQRMTLMMPAIALLSGSFSREGLWDH